MKTPFALGVRCEEASSIVYMWEPVYEAADEGDALYATRDEHNAGRESETKLGAQPMVFIAWIVCATCPRILPALLLCY